MVFDVFISAEHFYENMSNKIRLLVSLNRSHLHLPALCLSFHGSKSNVKSIFT